VIDAIGAKRYRDNLARHLDNWRIACRQTGSTLVTLVAEETVSQWLLTPLVAAGVLHLS
jgi:hypothetical protein